MRALMFHGPHIPLVLEEVALPLPKKGEARIKVLACGVCRTDLHLLDGEIRPPLIPLILGHQIVGYIDAIDKEESGWKKGDYVGIGWLGRTCGMCDYCSKNQENLCENAEYTGYNRNGGFAEYCIADVGALISLPTKLSAVKIAPFLCAGLIGYRAFRLIEGSDNIGFYGFGSSAHLLLQIAMQKNKNIFIFTKPGDHASQEFARQLGAVWAGNSSSSPPTTLDSAIIFAPAGELVPHALSAIKKGGTVVCAGIHMSDIPSFPYSLLWGEKVLRSVANLTRQDAALFFELTKTLDIEPRVTTYRLENGNQALEDLRQGKIQGSIVLTVM